MIAFATLFLGLTIGVQSVEVAVGDEVAAVAILLGGRNLGVIEGPPWSMDVDFGSELAPQLLEAVAFDAERQEINRARQHVNLPYPPVKLSVVLEGRPEAPTVLISSHRLSALRHCDLVLVLDGGRLVDSGVHSELIQRPGIYRDTWLVQSQRAAAEEEVAS